MKSFIKYAVPSALALAASVSAYAGAPTNSTTGSLFLFADVFNSSGTLVDAYAGDTQIAISSVVANTEQSTYTDSNLATLLGEAAQAGNTVVWTVDGGAFSSANHQEVVFGSSTAVSAQKGTALASVSGGNVVNVGGQVASLVESLSTTSGLVSTGVFADNSTGANGTWYNPNGTTNDVSNLWGKASGYGATVANTGLNGLVSLYELTAGGINSLNGGNTVGAVTTLEQVELTSNGLQFVAATSPVPVPAAIWLLGSGLMGLAGVARRKSGLA